MMSSFNHDDEISKEMETSIFSVDAGTEVGFYWDHRVIVLG